MDAALELETKGALAAPNFDAAWYASTYPDVAAVGMEPLEHYLWIGRQLGRKPGPAGSNSVEVVCSGSTLAGSESVTSSDVQVIPDESQSPTQWHHTLPTMPEEPCRWFGGDPKIARHSPVKLAPLAQTFNPDSLNLHWIVSGRLPLDAKQTQVLGLIRELETMGHRQCVWIQPPHHDPNEDAMKQMLIGQRLLGPRTVFRYLPTNVAGISGDAVVATDLWSCAPAVAMPLFKARFRLVQSLEAAYQVSASHTFVVEQFAALDLMSLCSDEPLTRAFEQNGTLAWTLPMAADETFFYPPELAINDADQRAIRVAIDLSSNVPEIAATFVFLALKKLQSVHNFEIVCFGDPSTGIDLPKNCQALGALTPEQRGDLFRTCQIGIALTPGHDNACAMEMLACGIEVVSLARPGNSPTIRGLHVVKGQPNEIAEGVVSATKALLDKRRKRPTMPPLGQAAKAIETAIRSGLSVNNAPVSIAKSLARSDYEHKAAVIIPTWNGGALFRKVLEALVTQKTEWAYDVLVVDSGSSDETLDITREFTNRGVRLQTIPNSEFQHGRTRNLAISLTSAEFVAVLTQDATPADERWLSNLVRAFDKGSSVAGVFGAHRAYPEATPYIANGIADHFEHFNRLPHVAHWNADHGDPIAFGTLGWQHWLHYYSDNNSCMRRSVWEKIPYPNIDWGEDQAWAWEIIKQGYEKAYAHDAVVLHSHNLTLDQQHKVSRTEGEFWLRFFGYCFEGSAEEVRASVDFLDERDRQFGSRMNLPTAVVEEQLALNRASVVGRFIGQASLLNAINHDLH